MKPYRDITTRAQLESVMAADGGPAVIDFWAEWCAPCRALAPHFEAVAREHAEGAVQFFKLDTEAHSELAQAFHIRSLPTIILVNNGDIADVMVGMASAEKLRKKVAWLERKSQGKGILSRLLGSSSAR